MTCQFRCVILIIIELLSLQRALRKGSFVFVTVHCELEHHKMPGAGGGDVAKEWAKAF